MSAKVSLKELVAREQVFAPCIYDCFSADAAEDAGYKAALISGGAVSGSLIGTPDMAFLNFEELCQVTQRICRHSNILGDISPRLPMGVAHSCNDPLMFFYLFSPGCTALISVFSICRSA